MIDGVGIVWVNGRRMLSVGFENTMPINRYVNDRIIIEIAYAKYTESIQNQYRINTEPTQNQHREYTETGHMSIQ
jgi:hypothetical protein